MSSLMDSTYSRLSLTGFVSSKRSVPTEFYATGNLIDFDVTDRLHEFDLPVLLIAGEYDEARPETLAIFQERIPGAKLEVIEDAAHASLSKQPEQYREILGTFLAEAEAYVRDSGRRYTQ